MKNMLLGVNIDHIATLRQARLTRYPDPVHAALLAEQAGADSITVHLREDRRHIQERDIDLLRQVMLTQMNLEMAITENMLAFAEKVKPEFCCLVPESREELTTEGGLDVVGQISKAKQACERLKAAGIRVSLFIDADDKQINAARDVGAEVIELHTGHFADAEYGKKTGIELAKIISGVEQAISLGLKVNAGHGLNYQNVSRIAQIPDIDELNIGHGIIARAVFTGLGEAVKEIKTIMQAARSSIDS
ncbi:MAG: pyridoxine 5'-phosphate synthase [Gammaproteobacteria bacterium]|nr:pyridoxine 5'-phosphate synthase [Gammaproteobacteria bacterium]